MSYCRYCRDLNASNLHKIYHDQHYGVRIFDDSLLFERLVLEINQAGLSWDLMLKRQENFREAFWNYDLEKIARIDEDGFNALMQNTGIIRNRLKINSVIYNAGVVLRLKEKYGSFSAWLDQMHPLSLDQWIKVFKKTFKFTGGEIVNEFLMSLAYLPGAHDSDCPFHEEIA
jgi:DNA-3-methyladenine glycosylase I